MSSDSAPDLWERKRGIGKNRENQRMWISGKKEREIQKSWMCH